MKYPKENIGFDSDEMKRMKALGLGLYKQSQIDAEGIKRWMDDGDVVEFTSPDFTASNAEFWINGLSSQRIWFSQLDGLYVDGETERMRSGIVRLRNGVQRNIWDLQPKSFWDFAKGRKFKVHIDDDFNIKLNMKNNKVNSLMQNGQNPFIYIYEQLRAKNYSQIEGMTNEARCYTLEEV